MSLHAESALVRSEYQRTNERTRSASATLEHLVTPVEREHLLCDTTLDRLGNLLWISRIQPLVFPQYHPPIRRDSNSKQEGTAYQCAKGCEELRWLLEEKDTSQLICSDGSLIERLTLTA